MANKSTKTMFIGLGILLAVILLAVGYFFWQQNKVEELELSGYVGGEKINFLDNPEVQKILQKDYGFRLDISKAGSLDMVQADDLDGRDFLWPSSQTALELYESLHGRPKKEENIFNTPIVLYSREYVAKGLVKAGIVEKREDVYWVNMPKLVQAMKDNKKWSDLGLERLHGSLAVHTTDPAKSNSGNMFSGLTANMLADNQVADENNIQKVLPELENIFAKIGYMETSSSNLFNLFLSTGMGNKPIVAGYENQLLELSKMEPDTWERAKGDIVIMYPEPTVWSSHILIALNDQGARLIEALQDERLQKIAWEEHGFRTGMYGNQVTDHDFDVPGVAEEITRIIQMPNYKTMRQIIKSFS